MLTFVRWRRPTPRCYGLLRIPTVALPVGTCPEGRPRALLVNPSVARCCYTSTSPRGKGGGIAISSVGMDGASKNLTANFRSTLRACPRRAATPPRIAFCAVTNDAERPFRSRSVPGGPDRGIGRCRAVESAGAPRCHSAPSGLTARSPLAGGIRADGYKPRDPKRGGSPHCLVAHGYLGPAADQV